MLFSCLQCHAQCTVIICINTYSDDATGDASFKIIFRGKKSSMRSAITQGNAKSLCRTNCAISTKFAGRSEQCKSQQVSSHYYKCPCSMNTIDEFTIIFY